MGWALFTKSDIPFSMLFMVSLIPDIMSLGIIPTPQQSPLVEIAEPLYVALA